MQLDEVVNSSELMKVNKETSFYSFAIKEYILFYLRVNKIQNIPIIYLKQANNQLLQLESKLMKMEHFYKSYLFE